MRAVDKSARVPGERLWPIVVGVEFIDGEAVVARRCKSQRQHRTQQGRCGDDLAIDGMALFRPSLETIGKYRQSSSLDRRVFPTLIPTPGPIKATARTGACIESAFLRLNCVFKWSAALRDFDRGDVRFGSLATKAIRALHP